MSCRIVQPRRGRDDELSELVAKALWRSFPGEHSVEGVAEAAREYFRDKQGHPISKRTIKYWLQGETLPSAAHLLTLAMMQPRLFISHILGGEA